MEKNRDCSYFSSCFFFFYSGRNDHFMSKAKISRIFYKISKISEIVLLWIFRLCATFEKIGISQQGSRFGFLVFLVRMKAEKVLISPKGPLVGFFGTARLLRKLVSHNWVLALVFGVKRGTDLCRSRLDLFFLNATIMWLFEFFITTEI